MNTAYADFFGCGTAIHHHLNLRIGGPCDGCLDALGQCGHFVGHHLTFDDQAEILVRLESVGEAPRSQCLGDCSVALATLEDCQTAVLHSGSGLVILCAHPHGLNFLNAGHMGRGRDSHHFFGLFVCLNAHHLADRGKTWAVNEDPIESLDAAFAIRSLKPCHGIFGVDASDTILGQPGKWGKVATVGEKLILRPGGGNPRRSPRAGYRTWWGAAGKHISLRIHINRSPNCRRNRRRSHHQRVASVRNFRRSSVRRNSGADIPSRIAHWSDCLLTRIRGEL